MFICFVFIIWHYQPSWQALLGINSDSAIKGAGVCLFQTMYSFCMNNLLSLGNFLHTGLDVFLPLCQNMGKSAARIGW
jgi:hypothetical protein